jgi:hypothetical protein
MNRLLMVALLLAYPMVDPSPAFAYLPLLAADDMPEGEDDMPEGDDVMPEGEEEPTEPKQSKPKQRPRLVEEMPPGEEDREPIRTSPSLVAVPPAPPCSLGPRSEGYLQADLDRPRSLDLHGLETQVELTEGDVGCIGQAQITITLESGCSLRMTFEQVSGRQFRLETMRLNADNCGELVGLKPGRYLLQSGDASLRLRGEAEQSCMPKSDLTISGSIILKKGRNEVPLNLDDLRIRGDFPILVDRTMGCRETRRAAPIELSSDRPKRRGGVPWPWIAGGVGASALGGAAAWYLLTRTESTGTLTLQIQ